MTVKPNPKRIISTKTTTAGNIYPKGAGVEEKIKEIIVGVRIFNLNGDVAVYQLLELVSQAVATARKEERDKIKSLKKDYLWQTFDPDTGEEALWEHSKDSPQHFGGSSVEYTWNKCIDTILSSLSVQDTGEECKHCGGDSAIRNPKGFCDHLYYPENCIHCFKQGGKI